MSITPEDFNSGINDDGTVEDAHQGVETDYAPCEGLGVAATPSGHYLAVICDYQDRFIETRIQIETLEAAGWIRDPSRPLPAYIAPGTEGRDGI